MAPPHRRPGSTTLSFAYLGDAGTNGDGKDDFACSFSGQPATTNSSGAVLCGTTQATPYALTVDYPDFTLSPTASTGLLQIVPGKNPSGNGLPTPPNANSGQSTAIAINSILKFTGNINLSCATQNPTWVFCFMSPTVQTVPSGGSIVSVLGVSTPATLPLGFSFGTAELRTSATKTVLAFLPLGFLAFCVRRRRMLSKALWVLIAVAAVSIGVSGCGGNRVAFYTPIPTGLQTVTVIGSYPGNISSGGTTPAETRTYAVAINIQ